MNSDFVYEAAAFLKAPCAELHKGWSEEDNIHI